MRTVNKVVRIFVPLFILLFMLTGCFGFGSKQSNIRVGKIRTARVIPTFQPKHIPVSCVVISHLLVQLPSNMNGKSISRAVTMEAAVQGADMLLIGGSRQAEDDDDMDFICYGPEQPYNFRDKWSGWKFGYEMWVDQGEWVSLAYKEWGNEDISYNFPIVMQAAFLQCKQ